MAASKDQKILASVLNAEDYRTFLSALFLASAKEEKINFSQIARKAGFSSRGFIPEVLDGRRRLTGNSFPKMIRTFPPSKLLKLYFTYLVQIEEPEINVDSIPESELRSRIEQLRAKIRAKLSLGENKEVVSIVYGSQHILLIYAALSDEEPGIPLSEIAKRTGLDEKLCAEVLRHLHAKQLVVQSRSGFRSANRHLIFEGLGEDKGFKASYLETLGELKRKANARFNAHDQLYFQSFYTVDRQRLPDLKKRLRELMMEFIEESGTDKGDCVSRLLVGFYY